MVFTTIIFVKKKYRYTEIKIKLYTYHVFTLYAHIKDDVLKFNEDN